MSFLDNGKKGSDAAGQVGPELEQGFQRDRGDRALGDMVVAAEIEDRDLSGTDDVLGPK